MKDITISLSSTEIGQALVEYLIREMNTDLPDLPYSITDTEIILPMGEDISITLQNDGEGKESYKFPRSSIQLDDAVDREFLFKLHADEERHNFEVRDDQGDTVLTTGGEGMTRFTGSLEIMWAGDEIPTPVLIKRAELFIKNHLKLKLKAKFKPYKYKSKLHKLHINELRRIAEEAEQELLFPSDATEDKKEESPPPNEESLIDSFLSDLKDNQEKSS